MPDNKREEVTDLLLAWRGGDDGALTVLLPLVYRQLKAIATRYVRGRSKDQTLETTALAVFETSCLFMFGTSFLSMESATPAGDDRRRAR
jgi:hypothetical protein